LRPTWIQKNKCRIELFINLQSFPCLLLHNESNQPDLARRFNSREMIDMVNQARKEREDTVCVRDSGLHSSCGRSTMQLRSGEELTGTDQGATDDPGLELYGLGSVDIIRSKPSELGR
jgi:hypothetical protein